MCALLEYWINSMALNCNISTLAPSVGIKPYHSVVSVEALRSNCCYSREVALLVQLEIFTARCCSVQSLLNFYEQKVVVGGLLCGLPVAHAPSCHAYYTYYYVTPTSMPVAFKLIYIIISGSAFMFWSAMWSSSTVVWFFCFVCWGNAVNWPIYLLMVIRYEMDRMNLNFFCL